MKETILIDTNEVIKILNLSFESFKKYKALGVIKACAKIVNKDLFDKGDILKRKAIIECCKKNGKSLDEILKYIKASEIDKTIQFEFKDFSRSKRILIIDDDELVCEFLEKYLMRTFVVNEVLIYHATDGIAGIKIAREIPQDLIIIDMVLGLGVDGRAVYKELMKDPRTNQSKFIFISGNFEFKSKKGIFFKKPVDMKIFVDKIEELIDLKRNRTKKVFCR